MTYTVSMWISWYSTSSDVRVQVEVANPIAAALAVGQALGLGLVASVYVREVVNGQYGELVGEFHELDFSTVPASSTLASGVAVVSYDDGL
jgi:hypothetical protein